MSINGWFNPPGTDLIIPYMVLNSLQELGEFYTYINEKSNLGYRIPTANKYLTGTIKVKMDGQLTGDGWFPTYSSKESFISGLLSKTTPLYLSGKLIGMLSPKSPTCIVGDSEIKCGQRYGGAYTSDGVFIHSTFSLDDASLSMHSVYPIMYSYAGYISFVLIFSSNNGESWGTSSIGSSPQCRMTDMDTFTNSLFDVTLLNGNLAPFDDVYDSLFNKKPYEPGGPSGPGGGGGSFGRDEISDTIPLPNGSTESNSSSAGMFTKYLVGTSQLTAFADYLWADNLLDALLKEIVQLIYGSASEAIISLLSIPFNPQSLGVSGRQGTIFIGSADSGVSAPILGSTFASWNWGSISISEYWGNFLDYAPHTKIELYLPFNVGFVTIDPNDVMDGTISITTNFEFDKGTCVHIVSGKNGVIGTYDGIIGRQLPITALDTSGKALSLAVGAVAAAVSLGSGAMGAAAAGAAAEQATYNYGTGAPFNPITIVDSPSGSQVKSTLQEVRRAAEAPFTKIQTSSNRVAAVSSLAAFRVPASIQRSGTMTGNGAGMNIQTPFIRVSRPTQSVPENYGHYVGYPSNILATLGTLRGYTEIASIHLDNFSCTIEEREEIDRLLKGGVIL